MRTSLALRTLAATFIAAAALTVPAAVPAAAATTAAPAAAPQWENGPVWGTVVSGGSLNLRAEPGTWSSVVGRMSHGASDRIQCGVYGQNINGNSSWFWMSGERGWASGAYISTSQGVPDCGNWRPSSNSSWNQHRDDHHRHDHNNPCRNDDPCDSCRQQWRHR